MILLSFINVNNFWLFDFLFTLNKTITRYFLLDHGVAVTHKSLEFVSLVRIQVVQLIYNFRKLFMTLGSRLEPCPLLLGMKTVSGNGEFWLDLNEELNSNLYQRKFLQVVSICFCSKSFQQLIRYNFWGLVESILIFI